MKQAILILTILLFAHAGVTAQKLGATIYDTKDDTLTVGLWYTAWYQAAIPGWVTVQAFSTVADTGYVKMRRYFQYGALTHDSATWRPVIYQPQHVDAVDTSGRFFFKPCADGGGFVAEFSIYNPWVTSYFSLQTVYLNASKQWYYKIKINPN